MAAWLQRIEARPAVQRGLDVPEPNKFKDTQDPEKAQKMIEEARKMMVSHKAD